MDLWTHFSLTFFSLETDYLMQNADLSNHKINFFKNRQKIFFQKFVKKNVCAKKRMANTFFCDRILLKFFSNFSQIFLKFFSIFSQIFLNFFSIFSQICHKKNVLAIRFFSHTFFLQIFEKKFLSIFKKIYFMVN